MKIYLAHSSGYDFQPSLYEPLKQTLAQNHAIFFPHDPENVGTKSKNVIEQSDVVLAEVTYPSTGQGIELGWASAAGKPIVCIHAQGTKVSSSLSFICDTFIAYTSPIDMTNKLADYFKK